MTRISTTKHRLEDASSLAALLDAAYEAFEETMSAIRRHEDRTGDSFAGFAFAAAIAADGRDAIAAAPSLPRSPLQPANPEAPEPGQGIGGLTADLAALSRVLAGRLADSARLAADCEDQSACEAGARQAWEIHALLAGNEP
jgi:hypothetical protein